MKEETVRAVDRVPHVRVPRSAVVEAAEAREEGSAALGDALISTLGLVDLQTCSSSVGGRIMPFSSKYIAHMILILDGLLFLYSRYQSSLV